MPGRGSTRTASTVWRLAHGALRRVLLGRRVPEIGHQAVAGMSGDKPAKPVDDVGRGVKVRVHNLAQLLGIQSGGQ
jgi:hypothetical protein